jgi:energy-coupling factor transport system permease protein
MSQTHTLPASTTTRWRTVDIVVAAVIAGAFGVIFASWNSLWQSFNGFAAFPPAKAILVGVWLVPAVLGPMIIGKPGAGVFTETVAAIISTLLGSPWGTITILYGVLQGVGGEAGFAATAYRSFRLPGAVIGGTLAGAAAGLIDIAVYYSDWSLRWQLAQVGISAASGLVVAGLGSWLLTRGLARTGVLDAFPAGRGRAAI